MQFPEICRLNEETTLQEIRKKTPFYVPEWNLEDEEDFGTVFSNIFSRMVDLISSKLNEAPKKHFLSFLEMINTSLIPASPARAPLTFVLSEGAPESPLIEAYTQVSAEDPNGNKVIFETEKRIRATPSKLVSVYSVIKEKDKIINHTDAINGVESTELFAGDSLQNHVLYIGDEHLFNVQQGQISIEFKGVEPMELSDPRNVEWMYSVESIDKENGKEVKRIDWRLLTPKLENKIIILNTENKPIDKVELNGIKSRWLKCQLNDSKIEDLKNLSIISIEVLASPSKEEGITPDFLFNNDIPIDPNSDSFHPFGKKPYLYDTLYIASKDAFSKKESGVTLQFELNPESSIKELDQPQLSWEYWDGDSWNLLQIKDENNLDINLRSESKELGVSNYKLIISSMPEVKLTKVNGKENYWIRVRLVGGNYGKEYEIIDAEVKPEEVKPEETKSARDSKAKSTEDSKATSVQIIPGIFTPPKINCLRINYNIGPKKDKQFKQPEYVFTENNLIFSNCAEKLKEQKLENNEKSEKNKGFKPFEALPDILPAVYFGFDKELEKGPFSLFTNVDESIEYPEIYKPKVKWQYLTKVNPELYKELEVPDETTGCTKKNPEVWEELEVLDETAGLTKKGMVQFNISGKMQASELFSPGNKFWIRAVLTENFFDATDSSGDLDPLKTQNELYIKYLEKFRPATYNLIKDSIETPERAKDKETQVSEKPEGKKDFEIFNINLFSEQGRRLPPKVIGFYLNSVWSLQSRTIYDEVIGSGTGEVNQKFKLVNSSIINEEIWVNEVTTLPEKERKKLRAEASNVKLRQDNKGNFTEFWVRWTRVNDFLSSTSKDRHYTIDKTDGEMRFGDGKYGMILPIGSDNIKATYSTGGGNSGNVGASKISKLQSSITYVDKVFNPISSSGGTENEDVDAFIERAPSILKTRNRAVAVEDYEWLAKEASDGVARAKAIPNFDFQGNSKTGFVTVIIVPESSNSKPVPPVELKRRVTSYLEERKPAEVMLRIIPPYYVKADISTELITTSLDAVSVIEKEARKKISEFLHPLTGNAEKKGWSFGCALCVSDIYSILEHIKYVEYVNKVTITLYSDMEVTKPITIISDECAMYKLPEFALPYSGEHEIKVKWENSQEEE